MDKIKLAIIGSREFTNYGKLCEVINRYFPYALFEYEDGRDNEKIWPISEIVSGGARGSDQLGARFAKENNITLVEYIPDWERFGKRAGFLRNEDIVKAADVCLCFWNGESRGTENSISIAKKLKKETIIIYI